MRNHHTLRLHTKFITTHAKNKTFQHNQFHTSISRLVECFEIITKLKSNKMNRNMKSWTRSEYARSRIASRDFFFKKKNAKNWGKKRKWELDEGRESTPYFGHGKREGTCDRGWPPWMRASELRSSSHLLGEGSEVDDGARSMVGFLNDFGLGPISTDVAHKPVYVDCSDNRFEQVWFKPV